MSFDNRKYLNSVAWRTYFRNTVLNTGATTDIPALWDTTIYPIDANENGASPMDISTDYFAVDNAGNIFSLTAINVGSNQYRITLEDTFFSGYAPTESLVGIIYKSAWKGYAFAIAPVWLNFLDRIARDKVNTLEKSILWRNDPNTLAIPFTNTKTPTISNWQSDQVINGKTVNLAEEHPKFCIEITISATKKRYYYKEPKEMNLVDGKLDNVIFDILTPGSGFILTSN
jgi:hypothetical protein